MTSHKNLFPFKTIRPGQRELLDDVKRTVKEGKHLLVHAPTGIGKTAAVLTPALEVGLKEGKTIFFLTPKHTQHRIVIDTLKKIKRKFKVPIIAIDFIGKQWTCPYPRIRELSSREFNEFCRKLKKEERCDYYNRAHQKKVSQTVDRLVKRIGRETLHAEEIKELCQKNSLCPYEMCVKAGSNANVIICDYFHIFSPAVRKAFLLRLGKSLEESILIIDEAHNLPGRVRKILSYSLSEFVIKRAIKEARFLGHDEIANFFAELDGILKHLGKDMKKGEKEAYVQRNDFIKRVEEETAIDYKDLTEVVDAFGEEVLEIPNRYRSYSKNLAKFLKNWAREDRRYARILSKDKFLTLSYRCLDPAVSTRGVFSQAGATVFMSGTLMPLEMYARTMDLDDSRTIQKEYRSPFPEENRLVLLTPGLTTRYKKRSTFMYQKYANTISRIIEKIPKNIAIFFPSYHVMGAIVRKVKSGDKELLIETKEMKKEERLSLYNRLVTLMKNKRGGGILAGVQAGSFSEGVDYPENLLNAVIVVGLPLGNPDLETKSLIEYYDFKFDKGWDYGYIYPAMNRALQAAGRCIRSETDRGAIILMDERFNWKNYSKCLPQDVGRIVTEIPENYVERFFK